jgi:alkylation response protein AidB-like acyl-CoA dehydrogenase
MSFSLSEEEEAIAETARAFFAEVSGRLAAGADWLGEVRDVARQGWLRPALDLPSGVGAMLAAEAAGYALLPMPFSELACGVPVALAGWEPAQPLLDSVTTGTQVWPLAGFDAVTDGLRGHSPLSVRRAGDGWRLSGSAYSVQAARAHHGYLVVAVDTTSSAFRLMAVPRTADVVVEPVQGIDEGCPVAVVRFHDVPVADAAELPAAAIHRAARWAAAAAAAEMLGCAAALRDLAVDHAASRHQFGVPIGSFQAVQHLCADMHVLVESLRVAVWAAGLDAETPKGDVDNVSVAKSYADTAAVRVGELSLQVHGGMGFTFQSPVHRYIRRIRRLASSFGDARWHREQLMARHLHEAGISL